MAEHEVGHTRGHLLGHEQAQRLHVGHKRIPARARVHATTMGSRGRGVAVAHVVVAAHQVARAGEEAGEVVVAVDVLGHTVDELHHPARTEATGRIGSAGGTVHSGRHPQHGMHRARTVGGIEGELGATHAVFHLRYLAFFGHLAFYGHRNAPFSTFQGRAPSRSTRG